MSSRNLKTRPRDYRKWTRSVRFTPKGSEKKELGRFDASGAFRGFGGFGQDFGSEMQEIGAGRGCPRIRPPAEGTHSELRTQDSQLSTRDSELRTQDSGLRTQNSGLRTQDSGFRTQNHGLRTQDSEFRTQDSGLRTQDAGLRAQDSELRTQNSGL